jgi:hypothetical protein
MDLNFNLENLIENRRGLLAELEWGQAIVRTFVRSVTGRYATGLYLHGKPGTAKTHLVRGVLDQELRGRYFCHRGHVTPLGLFELIEDHRDEIILLDDVAAILKSDIALQILLAALEPPPDRSRLVKYRRQGREEPAVFRGGIVCISNKELDDHALLGAFQSRVNVYHHRPTNAQLGALMLEIAERGWPAGSVNPEIDPETARTIAHHLIGELLRIASPFDLRLLVAKAFPLYLQWKHGRAEAPWRDLVTAAIEQHLVAAKHSEQRPVSRKERKRREHAIVEAVLQLPSRDEQVAAWTEQTGKSSRTFDRRKREIG